jgi:hypothetical protein
LSAWYFHHHVVNSRCSLKININGKYISCSGVILDDFFTSVPLSAWLFPRLPQTLPLQSFKALSISSWDHQMDSSCG